MQAKTQKPPECWPTTFSLTIYLCEVSTRCLQRHRHCSLMCFLCVGEWTLRWVERDHSWMIYGADHSQMAYARPNGNSDARREELGAWMQLLVQEANENNWSAHAVKTAVVQRSEALRAPPNRLGGGLRKADRPEYQPIGKRVCRVSLARQRLLITVLHTGRVSRYTMRRRLQRSVEFRSFAIQDSLRGHRGRGRPSRFGLLRSQSHR
jgi:hypothetical protein